MIFIFQVCQKKQTSNELKKICKFVLFRLVACVPQV